MGYRLSKIYTRTGDQGSTGLGDGTRIEKDHILIHAIGTVDELNSHIGLLICHVKDAEIRTALVRLQHQLFNLGGELATPGYALIKAEDIQQLETEIDRMNEMLPHLVNFILPGGSLAAAECHIARSICRNAERAMVTLHQDDTVRSESLQFINRLSDWLFVCARYLLKQEGLPEVLWNTNIG